MSQKQYTDEEKAAYYANKAKKKEGKPKKAKKLGPDGLPIKRSGCVLVEDFEYKGKNNGVGPMLYGWRISKKFGFMSFNAYLSQDMGRPQSGDHKDDCLVFVANIEVEGLGLLPPQSAVWSKKHRKLTMKGDLVANPDAPRKGYWGPGGPRRAKYVNK